MNQSVLLHPIPYSNESLANYIIRIKDINYLELKWIYERLDLPKSKYLRQFNLIQNEDILIRLSNFICLDVERVKSMTLNKYFHLSTFKGRNDYEYFSKYVISSDSSKYCPMCLAEKQYHRLYWQVRKIKVCLKHKISLIESCSNCGEILNIKSIIEGKCDCGHLLTDVNVQKCTNNSIINYQKYIYQIYDVNLNNEIIKKSQDYCKTTSELLINFIENLCEIDKKVSLELDSSEYRENYNCLSNIEYIEKIHENLPRELSNLLDSINYNLDCLNIQKREVLSGKYMLNCHTNNVYSPLFCLKLVDTRDKLINRLECAKYIDDLLTKYFYFRYNVNFIANRIKKDIDYINEEISILDYNNKIMNIFEIDDKTLESIVKLEDNIKMVNDCDYLYYIVSKIINIFLSMIKRTENVDRKISYDKEYISLYELYNLFSQLYISFLDIVNIIINDKINIVIDPFYIGTHMIYVPRETMKKKLLHLAVKRIKLDI